MTCRCEELFERTGYDFECPFACEFPPHPCYGSEDEENCLIPQNEKDKLDTPIPPGPGA